MALWGTTKEFKIKKKSHEKIKDFNIGKIIKKVQLLQEEVFELSQKL